MSLAASIFVPYKVQAYGPSLEMVATAQNEFRITVNGAQSYSQIDLYTRQEDSTLWTTYTNIGMTNSYGYFTTNMTINSFNPTLARISYVHIGAQDSNTVNTAPYMQWSPLYFVSTSLPQAYVGTYYRTKIEAAGGSGPYRYTLTSGILTQGLTLYSDGTIEGYPQYVASNDITIQATDSLNRTVSKVFTLNSVNGTVTSVNFKNGTLILDKRTVYIIYRGKKIGFANADAFTDFGYKWTNLYGTDSYSIPVVSFNVTTANDHHPWGTWVFSGQTIYFVHEYGLIPITTYDIFLNNGGDSKLLVPINGNDWRLPQLPQMTYNDYRLTNQADTSHVMWVQLGQNFTIDLEANFSTGYQWSANFNNNNLQLLNSSFQPYRDIPGSGGIQRFEFKALSRGETNITFTYRRSWEQNSLNQEIYKIVIQ